MAENEHLKDERVHMQRVVVSGEGAISGSMPLLASPGGTSFEYCDFHRMTVIFNKTDRFRYCRFIECVLRCADTVISHDELTEVFHESPMDGTKMPEAAEKDGA